MYSSTCFGRPHAHHQELNNCSSSLWFYRWSVVIAVLLVVVGPTWCDIPLDALLIEQYVDSTSLDLSLYVFIPLTLYTTNVINLTANTHH